MDRGTKATLTRTIPRSMLSRLQRICLSRYLNLPSASNLEPRFLRSESSYNIMILDTLQKRSDLCLYMITSRKATYRRVLTMDSGLEAFSLNPTHGSFRALTFPSTLLPIMRTNGSSRTELDLFHGDNFISRVKLTCLTTV